MAMFVLEDSLGLPVLALSEVCECGGSAKARTPEGLVCWACWLHQLKVSRSSPGFCGFEFERERERVTPP